MGRVAHRHERQRQGDDAPLAGAARQHRERHRHRGGGDRPGAPREVGVAEGGDHAPHRRGGRAQPHDPVELALKRVDQERDGREQQDDAYHLLEAPHHAQDRDEGHREHQRRAAVHQPHQHQQRHAHHADPEVEPDAQPHDVDRHQQRSGGRALLVVLPPLEPQPQHQDLGQAHHRVDLGLDRVLPEVVREREHERAHDGAELGQALHPGIGRERRAALVGRDGQPRGTAALGDADEPQDRQVGQEHGQRRGQR